MLCTSAGRGRGLSKLLTTRTHHTLLRMVCRGGVKTTTVGSGNIDRALAQPVKYKKENEMGEQIVFDHFLVDIVVDWLTNEQNTDILIFTSQHITGPPSHHHQEAMLERSYHA